MGEVVALVGAQYGSEGKGTIAYHLAHNFDCHVRTGAPNAGHTFLHEGNKFVMRSVPCGFVNPNASLIIGAGALIDLELLIAEIVSLEHLGYDIRSRLYLDPMAALIDPEAHHFFEGGVDGHAHRAIGSTGEGVGPARMARIARTTFDAPWAKMEFAKDKMDRLKEFGVKMADTAKLLNKLIDARHSVLLEGTQGSGLSLIHGPWPYCTSTDTNAAQMAADAGLSPSVIEHTILVARTHPIRVAGNSGPLRNETTWKKLGFEEERTTVTKKVRRVGEWDDQLIERAVMLNRPCELAITFLDYKYPDLAGIDDPEALSDDALYWFEDLRMKFNTPVAYAGTGPDKDGQKFQVVEV